MESVIYHDSHELKFKEGNTTWRTIVIYKFDNNAQMVRLDVLDESDAFFLYNLTVTREDYRQMQRAQNLTITFEHLPEALIWLLQTNKEANSKVYITIDYSIQATLTLEIKEIHSMRDVVHISLQFQKASLTEIQGRVELIRKKNEEKIMLLENCKEELNKKLEISEEKVCKLSLEVNCMKEKYATLQKEHQNNMELLSKQSESEKEKLVRDLTKNHEDKLEQLNREKRALQEQLDTEKNEKCILEKDVSILRIRIREESIKRESDAERTKQMERDLLTLRSRIQITKDQMEVMKNKCQSLLEEVEETKMLLGVSRRNEEQLKQQLSNFAARNCRLQEIVEDKSAKLEHLNFDLARQQLQIQQKTADLEGANEKIRSNYNDMTYLKLEQRALSWKLEESQKREAALKKEKNNLQKQTKTTIEGLQKELEKLKQEKMANKNMEDKLSNLQKLLDAKDQEINLLKKELSRYILKDSKVGGVGNVPYLYNQHYMQESNLPVRPDDVRLRIPLSNIAEDTNTVLGNTEQNLANTPVILPTSTKPELPKPQQGNLRADTMGKAPAPKLTTAVIRNSAPTLPLRGLTRKK
uniref:Spindle assembly abnormal protein 6 N-terminal domain-containing protein n=1 Tax=Cuerna arida TaxID=1464854 RepID=A0A1B6FTS9_9HEMI